MDGGCLCGSVRYRIGEAPKVVANCHCGMCRRQSGAAFLTFICVDESQFKIVSGSVESYRSSQEATRGFCRRCGSPLTFIFDASADEIWITAGSLDSPGEFSPVEDWFVDDKLPWSRLDPERRHWRQGPGV